MLKMKLKSELKLKISGHIRTFGCQMNVYDTGKMEALLAQDGYVTTEDVRSRSGHCQHLLYSGKNQLKVHYSR